MLYNMHRSCSQSTTRRRPIKSFNEAGLSGGMRLIFVAMHEHRGKSSWTLMTLNGINGSVCLPGVEDFWDNDY